MQKGGGGGIFWGIYSIQMMLSSIGLAQAHPNNLDIVLPDVLHTGVKLHPKNDYPPERDISTSASRAHERCNHLV